MARLVGPDELTVAWSWGSRVGQADGVLEGELDGQLVVFQPANGEYAGLDGTSAVLWELLTTPTTFGALVDMVAGAYQQPPSSCAPDIAACLEGLRRQGLVSLDAS